MLCIGYNSPSYSFALVKGNQYSDLYHHKLGFLGGSVVKNPPAMQETQVQSLGQEDPIEKEKTPHSIIFVENSMGREAWQATVPGVAKELGMT